MKHFKILFISNRILTPVRDGHTQRSYNLLKGLSKEFDIHLLSLYENVQEISRENILTIKKYCKTVDVYPCPAKYLSREMIGKVIRSVFSKYPYTVWRHYSKGLKNRALFLQRKENFDIVHCDVLPMIYSIENLKQHAPITLTDHDVSYLKCISISRQINNPLIKYFMVLESLKLKMLEKNLHEYADAIVTVSESDKILLRELSGKGNFIVIENGVDPETFFMKNVNDNEKRIVWLGGFSHIANVKAVHYFLDEIYPKIKEKVKNVRFDIIGENPTLNIINYANNDKSLILHGFVKDPVPIIQKATVFIAPLLSGGGTKLKVIEGMALGKAIVGTTIAFEGLEGINNYHYVLANETIIFANNVISLLNNKKIRENIGNNARKLAIEKYSWENIVEKLKYKYLEIIDKNFSKNLS